MELMPNRFMMVPPGANPPEVINVIVEIPKGRRSKFEVDKATGLLRLDRYLYSSAHYPGDYGFIPQTLADDGDPLDVLVMVNEPTFCGCLIEARPLGIFRMTDKGSDDYKILAVPNTDPIFAEHHDLWRVPPHFLREVEHFFATYKQLEGTGGEVKTQGWENVDQARLEILESITRYQKNKGQVGGVRDPKKVKQPQLVAPTSAAPVAPRAGKSRPVAATTPTSAKTKTKTVKAPTRKRK